MNTRRTTILYLCLCAFCLLSLEIFARTKLFNFVSYYNYDAIDWQMTDFKAMQKVDTVFIGSSEVRYGLDPEKFDAELGGTSFNLGIDGLNLSYYRLLLPYLKLEERSHPIRYAVIGLNVTEDVVFYPVASAGGFDCKHQAGVLQRGLFTSAFGTDSGLSKVCKTDKKIFDQASASLESISHAILYRKPLRTFLLNPSQRKRTREQLDQTDRGFHVRPPQASQDLLDAEFEQWWQTEGKNSSKLSDDSFNESIAPGGVYATYIAFFREQNIVPIFVSLPTNPKMIQLLNRIETYRERSLALKTWFTEQGVEYVDLGLKFDYDPVRDFADRRHLSRYGAQKFSTELGAALKRNLQKN
jgi:hypothetical protein